MSPRVAVVGGGVAGLATAALLARDGYEVDLFEKGHQLGGRAGVWRSGGFTFDTGPSWYLMPEAFDHFFRLVGTTGATELDLHRPDPAYRAYFEDADPLDVAQDLAANAATFERIEPGAGRRLVDYVADARDAYDIALRRFLYTSYDSALPLLARDIVARPGRLTTMLTRPLADHVAGQFADPRLRRLLTYHSVFLGISPFRAPSMYRLMSALDLAGDVIYPRGGFAAVVEALTRAALRHGARLHTGREVTAIETRRTGAGRTAVVGVRWRDGDGHRRHAAQVVVACADMHHVETDLLPPSLRDHSERWWARRDPGPGAVLAMLGVQGHLPALAHHTLLMAQDWRGSFAALTDGRLPTVPSTYVCRPSATDPDVAPAGHENLFVLVPVPADVRIGRGGIDGAGDPAVEAIADAAIARIADWTASTDLADRIVVRRTMGPADFASQYHSWSGGMLGPAHSLRQSAMFRARNRSTKVAGLYHAGASTVPGVGVPMCLISAELVAKRLRGDRSGDPLTEPGEEAVG